MTFFDIRTGVLIVGILYLFMPTFTWIVLAKQRNRQITYWCLSGVLMGFATTLMALSGAVPGPMTFAVVATCWVSSNFLRVQSLRLDLDAPLRWQWMVAIGVAIVALVLGIRYGLDELVLSAQANSLFAALFYFYIAKLAYTISVNEHSRSAGWISWVYGLLGCSFFYRVYTLALSQPSPDVFLDRKETAFVVLAGLFSSVIGHFGYLGLALDRARRRELQAVADKVRDEERLRLGTQIAQLDRRRSLGELSASLGHELNQPLTAILTNAQVVQISLQKTPLDGQTIGLLTEKIIHNTKRAAQIVERIRAFIRPSVPSKNEVDLNTVVHEVISLVADDLNSRQITLHLHLASDALLVKSDFIHLSQVVLNLLRNAIDAVTAQTDGQITVTTARRYGKAVLWVRDNGIGLSAEAAAQAGEPFFTTKAQGLGVGLSISKSIAAQYDGTLTLVNAPIGDRTGALAELKLPAWPGER